MFFLHLEHNIYKFSPIPFTVNNIQQIDTIVKLTKNRKTAGRIKLPAVK